MVDIFVVVFAYPKGWQVEAQWFLAVSSNWDIDSHEVLMVSHAIYGL